MSVDVETPLNLREDVTPHNCFGCGRLNVHGLQLELMVDPEGDGVVTRFVPPAHAEGYRGMVHGGIISTVLDEVMAWSLYRQGIWAVTGQLTTKYRKPVLVGEPTVAVGSVLRNRGRVIEVRGEIRRESDNVLLADGIATFLRVSESQAEAWKERYGGIAQVDTEGNR
jgi:acyl-coenzyme A thioesterase PaaI-like protein